MLLSTMILVRIGIVRHVIASFRLEFSRQRVAELRPRHRLAAPQTTRPEATRALLVEGAFDEDVVE